MDQDIFSEAVAEERRLISKGNNVREDFVRDYCYREMARREEQYFRLGIYLYASYLSPWRAK